MDFRVSDRLTDVNLSNRRSTAKSQIAGEPDCSGSLAGPASLCRGAIGLSCPIGGSWFSVSHEKVVAALLQQCQDRGADPRYLAFFECFNRQLFFEAHEVLEELWLVKRAMPRGLFYKGLIQLAGAFVHVQKRRPQPAAALLRLAANNLQPYMPNCDGLDVAALMQRIGTWLRCLDEHRDTSLLPQTPAVELVWPGQGSRAGGW